MKNIFKFQNKVLYIIFGIIFLTNIQSAHAAWADSTFTIPYDVGGNPPTVTCGPTQTISSSTSIAQLTAGADDSDGKIVFSRWVVKSQPSPIASVSTPTKLHDGKPVTHNTQVQGMTDLGDYVYEFTADDNDGLKSSCTTTVTVKDFPDLQATNVNSQDTLVSVATPLTATIFNSGKADTGVGFNSLFQVSTDSTFTTGVTDVLPAVATSALTKNGGSTNISRNYTFTSTGTYYVQACADKSSWNSTGTINEGTTAAEGNNCSTAATITVHPAGTMTATLTATPSIIYPGQTSKLTWTSFNATSCTGTNFSTGNAANNASTGVNVSPVTTTIYAIRCINGSQSVDDSATVTVRYQCSDSIDNDGDGVTDRNDPGCHSDGNASNDASYVPTDNSEVNAAASPQCSDSADNDNDGMIDASDPGCYTNGVYNPLDPDEYNEKKLQYIEH